EPGRAHARHARIGADVPARRREEPEARAQVPRGGQVKQLFALLLALVVVLPAAAFAQPADPPSMSARAEPRDVEVGEPFSISLKMSVDSSVPAPGDPRLAVPDGIRVGPPSISNGFEVSFINGRVSRRTSITATWQAIALREGVFVVTPSAAW